MCSLCAIPVWKIRKGECKQGSVIYSCCQWNERTTGERYVYFNIEYLSIFRNVYIQSLHFDLLIFIFFLYCTGIKKLKLSSSFLNTKIFLEDGFKIDEDEILLSSITENKIWILSESANFINGK